MVVCPTHNSSLYKAAWPEQWICAGRYVYDGELEGQMTMLFDSNKRLIKVNSIYPEDVQLGKGTYTIRALLRHDDRGKWQPLYPLVQCD